MIHPKVGPKPVEEAMGGTKGTNNGSGCDGGSVFAMHHAKPRPTIRASDKGTREGSGVNAFGTQTLV